MRLDVVILSGLIVAGSAAVFGDLGRASSPVSAEPLVEVLDAGSVTLARATPASATPSGDTRCRRPGRPMATSLQFLEPGNFGPADLTPDCPAP